MILYDFNPYKLPPELLLALGRLTTCAAQTEDVVSMAIGDCLGMPGLVAMTVTTHMNMPMRFNALRSAAAMRYGEGSAQHNGFIEIVARIEKAFDLRNKYVHRLWCRSPDGDMHLLSRAAKRSLNIKTDAVSVDDVEKAAEVLYFVGMELVTMLDELGIRKEV